MRRGSGPEHFTSGWKMVALDLQQDNIPFNFHHVVPQFPDGNLVAVTLNLQGNDIPLDFLHVALHSPDGYLIAVALALQLGNVMLNPHQMLVNRLQGFRHAPSLQNSSRLTAHHTTAPAMPITTPQTSPSNAARAIFPRTYSASSSEITKSTDPFLPLIISVCSQFQYLNRN